MRDPDLTSSPAAKRLVIVGAGPAGLTAGFDAASSGWKVTVLEKDPIYVGGISRTVQSNGYRFDIGGHRFFSKSPEVNQWWKARLPDDFIQVRRMSRIFYRRRFFDYPLKPWNALSNLGLFTSIACICSYAWRQIFPHKPERSFEDWVTNRFGSMLFSIFFKTYTEKVWGIPTSELSADWAAQRIKGLSLSKAVINAFRGRSKDNAVIKTLIDTFSYPRLGPGQMWEKAAADLAKLGATIVMSSRVLKVSHASGRVVSVSASDETGGIRVYEADQFIISMPLRETVAALDPPAPEAVSTAAERLKYRDFITVALVVEGANPFPDNWIYIHDPTVKLGRIQNFKNWSDALVGRSGTTCLGLEYFCFEGDGLWNTSDAELVELGKRELGALGLVNPERVVEGHVVRMEKAYPVYDPGYQDCVSTIRTEISKLSNLQVVGRNGMHKYNNQDHSMMTGILAVRNICGESFNLWNVNTDAEYHEEDSRGSPSGRSVPERAG